MGEFTHHFHDPFVPAGKVMDHDHAGEFSRPRGPCIIGLTLVAVMTAKQYRFRLQALIIAHANTPSDNAVTKIIAWTAGSWRATVEDRLVGHVAVDKLDGIVGTRREGDVAHQRPTRKLAFDMSENAVAILFGVEDGADANIGNDLLR